MNPDRIQAQIHGAINATNGLNQRLSDLLYRFQGLDTTPHIAALAGALETLNAMVKPLLVDPRQEEQAAQMAELKELMTKLLAAVEKPATPSYSGTDLVACRGGHALFAPGQKCATCG